MPRHAILTRVEQAAIDIGYTVNHRRRRDHALHKIGIQINLEVKGLIEWERDCQGKLRDPFYRIVT